MRSQYELHLSEAFLIRAQYAPSTNTASAYVQPYAQSAQV